MKASDRKKNAVVKPKNLEINLAVLPPSQKNFVIGIDECICVAKSTGPSITSKDVAAAEEIPGAREWTNKRYDEGNIICFLTTREEKLRRPTEAWLESHGFKYHSLIMNKPVAEHYHYIDDRHVQATTFRGKFASLVRKEQKIQVFS